MGGGDIEEGRKKEWEEGEEEIGKERTRGKRNKDIWENEEGSEGGKLIWEKSKT